MSPVIGSGSEVRFLTRHGRPGQVAFRLVPAGTHSSPGRQAGAFLSAISLTMAQTISPARTRVALSCVASPPSELLSRAFAHLEGVRNALRDVLERPGPACCAGTAQRLSEACMHLAGAIMDVRAASHASRHLKSFPDWVGALGKLHSEAELVKLGLEDVLWLWDGSPELAPESRLVLEEMQPRVRLWLCAVRCALNAATTEVAHG